MAGACRRPCNRSRGEKYGDGREHEQARHIGPERMKAFIVRHGYSGRTRPEVLVERLRTHLLTAAPGTTFAQPGLRPHRDLRLHRGTLLPNSSEASVITGRAASGAMSVLCDGLKGTSWVSGRRGLGVRRCRCARTRERTFLP